MVVFAGGLDLPLLTRTEIVTDNVTFPTLDSLYSPRT